MYFFDYVPKEKQVLSVDSGGQPIKNPDGSFETKAGEKVFVGKVKVKIPKHSERLQFLKQISLAVSNDGTVDRQHSVDLSEKIIAYAVAHIESVDLTRSKDQMKFGNVDMLEYDVDGLDVLSDIGKMLMDGVRLSKS